jgi:phosphocarrier protein HPr
LAELVGQVAGRLQTAVTIEANGRRANAKSILEILALGVVGDTELTIVASGPDAAGAVDAIAEVIASLGT